MAPISVAIEEMVMRPLRSKASTASPVELGRSARAGRRRRIRGEAARRYPWACPEGRRPSKDDLHRIGDLEPDLAEGPSRGDVLVAHALAEGADGPQDIGVGIGRDEGPARGRPSPPRWRCACRCRRRRRKRLTPLSRAKSRQSCWLAAYFWSDPPGLQSKVKKVLETSATGRPCSFRFLTTFAPPKSRASRASTAISTMSPGRTGRPACRERIFSMRVWLMGTVRIRSGRLFAS